jgi:carboxyl-terminal processing protease
VDLRYNPGGLLSQVENIVDFFQNDGIIVSTKARRPIDSQVRYASKMKTIVPDEIPVVVLIDQGSASASEIFSGAIKDTARGILVGEKSYGKGSVQTIVPLGEDGFKITMAKYYTPAGISIDKIGIMPDIEVKEPELTDPEKEALKNIYNDKVIEQFAKKNTKPSDDQINGFVKELQANPKYRLQERQLRRLIKNSLDAYDDVKSVYDLEYDIQLQKAVEVLDKKQLDYKNGKFIHKK